MLRATWPVLNAVLHSLFFVLIMNCQIHAQEQQWTNAFGGDFTDAANWNSDVPDATEDARFDLDATYGVNLTSDQTIAGFSQGRGVMTLSGGFALNANDPSDILDGTLNLQGQGTHFNQIGEFAVGRNGGNANLNVLLGASLSTQVGRIGYTSDATGAVTVDGAGSQWSLSSNLIVGREGDGNLTVQNGGQISAGSSLRIGSSGTTGTVLVTGSGSSLSSSASTSQVGSSGVGTLRIENGGQSTFSSSIVGNGTTGNGSVLVDGSGSQWNVTATTTVGGSGTGVLEISNGGSATTGSILTLGTSAGSSGTININGGGALTSHLSRVGHTAGSNGEVNVAGTDSQWNITNQLFVGNSGDGALSISDGGQVTVRDATRIGSGSGTSGYLNISGAGSELVTNGLDVGSLGDGSLSITDNGLVTSQFANIGRQDNGSASGIAVVSGAGSRWNNAGSLDVGAEGTGSLSIEDGGTVTTIETNVAQSPGSNGSLLITGAGSQLVTDFFVAGGSSTGNVAVEQGGRLQTTSFASLGKTGTAHVSGGSQWINDDDVVIGGSLTIETGGTFTSGTTFLGPTDTTGSVVVKDAGSTWTSDQGLAIGRFGTGNLEIRNGGFVSNQGTGIGVNGGSGSLLVDGAGSRFRTNTLEVGFAGDGIVTVSNGGLVESTATAIYSDGSGSQAELTVTDSGSSFINSGLLRIGIGAEAGRLNVIGSGLVNTDETLINEFGALAIDNAAFSSMTPVQNWGTIQFTGDSELTGGIELLGVGRIETFDSASAIVNGPIGLGGSEVFTELGSVIRFNDDVSGSGAFTGLGEVEIGGLFDHGNLSLLAEFEGDVNFLADSTLKIEIGGTDTGSFDQLLIDGDLSLGGELAVSLEGGFELEDDMEFLFANVGGSLTGQFSGLGENSLVGNFGGQDLYISYGVGSDNGLRLFTSSSVPEPCSTVLLVVLGMMACSIRRKQSERSL